MDILPRIAALILALPLALPASAQTGLVLFPADQYGRSYLSTTQSSGAMSTMELQNVLGRNPNFERLESYRADDRFRRLAAPVGRLDLLVQTPAGLGTSTCTASIVSSRYILTNHHCFPDGVRAASLLMDFYREDDDGGGNDVAVLGGDALDPGPAGADARQAGTQQLPARHVVLVEGPGVLDDVRRIG
jgi:hypothetical protein